MSTLRVSKVILLFSLVGIFFSAGFVFSEETPPKNAFGVFGTKLGPRESFFNTGSHKVVDLGRSSSKTSDVYKDIQKRISIESVPRKKDLERKAIRKKSISDEELLSRVDPNAPDGFKKIVIGLRSRDMAKAAEGADLFVDYMVNLMWEVREITKLIGGALLRRGLIKEESWDGVEQYLEYELAQARKSMGSPMKITHEESLKKIKPDPQHKVEIYYFFTLSCSYCRYMASDVERLYRAVVKNDNRVKLVGLTFRNTPVDWVKSYRRHTGLTIPIFEGKKVAESLDISFVPSFVVISPTTKKAYKRSGQMTFDHMYEFVRAVQGLPAPMTRKIKNLKKLPISMPEQYGGMTKSEAMAKRRKGGGKNKNSTESLLERVRNLGK